MTRSLQHLYTTSHTTAEARNPRFLLTSRIPVLLLQVLQVPRRNAFDVVITFSRQHMKECRAQDIICNGCGIKGHLKKCCKKSGKFPKDSNRQNNQSSSTGPGKMNIASAVSQADFFDEKGVLKEYTPQNQHTGSMYVLKKFQGNPSNDILFSDNGVEVQHSVPGSDPTPIPTPDFPFQEFPLTEVVKQSQIDISSISDTSDPRETSNSSSKAIKSPALPLQSSLANRSHEELGEYQRFGRIRYSSYTIFERF